MSGRGGHLQATDAAVLHARSSWSDMPLTTHRIDVQFDYPLEFTRGVFDPDNATLAQVIERREGDRRHRVLFVLDGGLVASRPAIAAQAVAYGANRGFNLAGDPLVLPGGEVAKNEPAHLDRLLRRMHDERLDRHAFVVVVGGGAILDLAGYAAAIVHRGVRIVRLPSTTLAQADAGVGVKNGVNAFGRKNFLGTFAVPFGVVCDLDLLDSLSIRDRRAGLAEVVKVAILRDEQLFGWLTAHDGALADGDPHALEHAVRRGAELHLQHIQTSGDAFEQGSARPLDFGHWAAHKLEAMTGHRLRHGEAVAIGMALDVRYAARAGLVPKDIADRILATLLRLGFALSVPELETRDARGRLSIIEGLEDFREHLGGTLTVTMPIAIGRTVDLHAMDATRVTGSVADLVGTRAPPRVSSVAVAKA